MAQPRTEFPTPDGSNNAVHPKTLREAINLEAALMRVARESRPFALDSAAPHQPGGRFSILGFDPVDSFTLQQAPPDWLDQLRRRVGPPGIHATDDNLPFVGGWVGHVSYEAAALLEGVVTAKPRDPLVPQVRFALYDTVALFDHHEKIWTLTALDLERPSSHRRSSHRPPAGDRLDHLERILRGETLRVVNHHPEITHHSEINHADATQPPRPEMTRRDYEQRAAHAKQYIADGDIYQVNLTQPFTTTTTDDSLDIYRRLRRSNPGAYSAYLPFDGGAILSSSPELFLSLRNGKIITRPIKGTRPRSDDPDLDALRRRELRSSEKDLAELTMIVDLMRNDLGRVSRTGTVRVRAAADLETHPTVHHLVATIESELHPDKTWSDLLKAALPAGSITGCPKIRAMQIINELEIAERGPYCGAIGYIGLDGSAAFNVAIRTMIHTTRAPDAPGDSGDSAARGVVRLCGGGAITSDSDLDAEYEETLAKVKGMVDALTPSPADTHAERITA
jgi:para-aminobenzoate synthetase component 1